MIVDISIPDIDKVRKRMKGMENKAETAMSRAINRTITYVSGQIVDESKRKYVVKGGAVKKTLRIRKSSRKNLSGEVASSAKKKIPLSGFRVSPAKPNYVSPPEVYKSKVLAESGMKGLTGSGDRSKGFVAKMSSGHIGVFQRQTASGSKENQTIAELFGPSIPSTIKAPRVSKTIRRNGAAYLRKRLDVEINSIMRGYVK